MSTKTAFQRYAPFIQEYIYEKGWTDLRNVQKEACEAIMDTNDHLVIASGTASGKTEAAFFPILTMLEKDPPDSIGVLYIGPLKALINDQFQRLNGLLEKQDIPVWPWHGDVSPSLKKNAMKVNKGIMQITPESLEALIMRNPGLVQKLFRDLRFVVVDEIHALMGEDRGLQVLSLLERIERMTGNHPRRIGLSATLNDYEPAKEFIAAGTKRKAQAVGIQTLKRQLSLCVESFEVPIPKEDENGEIDYNDLDYFKAIRDYNNFIYDNSHNKKCIIFTNSRRNAEEVIKDMKSIASARKEDDVFHVHHGSIAKALREETEHALRDSPNPVVTAATLTLELGIDIGSLDTTVQIGAPYSCSSFVQRIGRSGRVNGRSQMLFVNKYEEESRNFIEELPWDLLRSIAVIEIYLRERWVEPFSIKPKPFSLLAHQTLSTLMVYGELTPQELAQKVLNLAAFKGRVSAAEYKELLQNMMALDYIHRMDEGTLIVGMKGESLTNYYGFYSVFSEEDVYKVMTEKGEIGTLNNCPALDEVFILAGQAWRVKQIDEEKRILYVQRSHSTRIPTWLGSGADIHEKIVKEMKKILQDDKDYSYLRPGAKKLLEEARIKARDNGLLDSEIHSDFSNTYFILPWTGTKEIRTIAKLLTGSLKDELGIQAISSSQLYLEITTYLSEKEFMKRLRNLSLDVNDPYTVLPEDRQAPRVDKYDHMVPDDLLRTAYLYNQMDVPKALDILKSIKM